MTKANEGMNRIQKKGRKPRSKDKEIAIALGKSMDAIAIQHRFEDAGKRVGISTIYGWLRNKS